MTKWLGKGTRGSRRTRETRGTNSSHQPLVTNHSFDFSLQPGLTT
ncbi:MULTISPECIES: hypothetical protein [Chroococcidiopsis]|nr:MULTISPECIES: hypothetical protein [Chroococcidiopsis]